MSNDNDTEKYLTDHEYDGIQEYDNPLPNWWLMTFYGTVIFGFFYWIHYTFGGGLTLRQELKQEMAVIEQQQKASGVSGEPVESEEVLAALLGKPEVVAHGKEVFAAKCAVCHGPELQGLIGPNLTDDFWIHGKGSLSDIITVVRKGVLDKGMIAWETQLPKPDIQAVVAFVKSRHGSNPPNPKAPQGEKVAN